MKELEPRSEGLPYYLQAIRNAVGADVSLLDCCIIEELMRGDHGTLDHLSAQAFRGSARRQQKTLVLMRADSAFADVVEMLTDVARGPLLGGW